MMLTPIKHLTARHASVHGLQGASHLFDRYYQSKAVMYKN